MVRARHITGMPVWIEGGHSLLAGRSGARSGVAARRPRGDAAKSHADYRQPVDLDDILESEVDNPHLDLLQEKLPDGA